MAIQGIYYVHAYVSDLARAKQFYGETLGWKQETDRPGVAGFRFGSGYLVLIEDARAASERRTGARMSVALRVDDLEAEHAQLTERGVEAGPITDQRWGERNFNFTDPDGYQWVYAQPNR
jgi:catechol 2,3-dioxygenase-like lactoylglutathione lyase family enzyme